MASQEDDPIWVDCDAGSDDASGEVACLEPRKLTVAHTSDVARLLQAYWWLPRQTSLESPLSEAMRYDRADDP